jgi:hypothetical protein
MREIRLWGRVLLRERKTRRAITKGNPLRH